MCTLHNITSLWFWGTIRLNMWGVRFISWLCIDSLLVTCTPVSWAAAPNLQQHLWSGATVSTSEFYCLPRETWHFTLSVQRPQQKNDRLKRTLQQGRTVPVKTLSEGYFLFSLTGGKRRLDYCPFFIRLTSKHPREDVAVVVVVKDRRTAINTGSLYGLSCVVVVYSSFKRIKLNFLPKKFHKHYPPFHVCGQSMETKIKKKWKYFERFRFLHIKAILYCCIKMTAVHLYSRSRRGVCNLSLPSPPFSKCGIVFAGKKKT